LLLAAGSVPQSGGGEAVDLAQGALGQFVESGEGVIGEEVAFAADEAEPVADVLGGVGHGGGGEQEAVVDAGEQGAVSAAGEVLLQLGESDEDEREQCPRIPLV